MRKSLHEEMWPQEQPFIVDGEIVRNPRRARHPLYCFSPQRFLLALSILAILVISNPANQPFFNEFLGARRNASKTNKGRASKSNARKQIHTQKITNFGILSIEERFHGVLISGLYHSWLCRFESANMGSFCEFIGKQSKL